MTTAAFRARLLETRPKKIAPKKKPERPKRVAGTIQDVLGEVKEIRALLEAQGAGKVKFQVTERDANGKITAFKVVT